MGYARHGAVHLPLGADGQAARVTHDLRRYPTPSPRLISAVTVLWKLCIAIELARGCVVPLLQAL